MKTIVIYYSVSGQTQFVTEQISKKIECDVLKIQTEVEISKDFISQYYHGSKSMLAKELPKLRAYQFNPDDYDNIILGFPNWASNCPPAMKAFLTNHSLSGKNIYLFTTYVARGGTKCLENVAKMLGKNTLKGSAKFSLPTKKSQMKMNSLIKDFLETL